MAGAAAAAAAGRRYVDFVPPHSLLEEPDKVVLRVDLTAEGFRKDQLRVQIDKLGTLRISGERPLRADSKRWRRFSRDFQVPECCDAGAIRARLEKGGVLLITMPRLSSPAKEPTTVAGAVVDAKDQQLKDNTMTRARQQAAEPAAEADDETKDKEDAGGGGSMEQRRDQADEQCVTSSNAGGAASSAGRPAYGFAKSGRRMVWAIAALVLALIGAGLYARYRLMDPSAETTALVALSDN